MNSVARLPADVHELKTENASLRRHMEKAARILAKRYVPPRAEGLHGPDGTLDPSNVKAEDLVWLAEALTHHLREESEAHGRTLARCLDAEEQLRRAEAT